MKVLKIAIIMLVLIMSVGAVCAADSALDDVMSDDSQDILKTTQDDISEVVQPKTFTDLKHDIGNSSDVFVMKDDYKFDNVSDNSTRGIVIDRDNFVINGNGYTIDASSQSAIFAIRSKNVTINNLTFINANSSWGSVFYLAPGSSLTTNHANFIDNNAEDSVIYNMGVYSSNHDSFRDCTADMGVIKLSQGELYVDDAVMTSSKMLNWGFIYTETPYSNITITNSIFANTTSNYSAAVRGSERTLIRNTQFINLYSEISAGAVGLKDVIFALIDGCTFINATSQKNAGAVLVDAVGEGAYNGNSTIFNSNFVDCGSGFGGAIMQLGGGLVISYCNFTNNSATFDGGAVYVSQADVYISNSTFIENNVYYDGIRGSFGGAIYCDYSTLQLENNEIINSSAQYGGGVYGYDLSYYIEGNSFAGNTNFNGSFDDIYTVFDWESILGTNVYSGDDSYDLNNTDYATIIGAEGMKLVILNNTIDVSVLPSKFDLRDWGWATPVRDQGRAGACWTFGSSGAMESAILRYLGIEMDISENNMEDVSLEYNPYGIMSYTEGGSSQMAAAYALSWFGVFSSEYDVYDQLGKISPIFAVPSAIHFQDVVFIPPRNNVTDNDLLKRGLLKYGALAVGYAADQLPPLLNPETSAQYNNETEAPDHGVALIGWDDNYSASNFLITPPGDGAWIIKNSWGAKNGDEGYYYISYYDVNFATTFFSVGYVLENTVEYNKNYQYDIQGLFSNINMSTEYLNNFVAVGDDLIAGVGTYFNDSDVEYRIEIYVNDVLKLVQTGVSPFYGFHTIKLDSYVPVKKGDVFAVKIISNSVPILIGSRQHHVKGTSQVLFGDVWTNVTDMGVVASIKAYTVADDSKITNNANITVDYDGGKYFSVKVVTEDGHGVVGADVKFTINGQTKTVKTGSDGTAKIKITDVPKKYTITTRYNNKDYKNTVTVKQVLTASKVTVKKTAKKFTLKATLKINGKLVKGKKITFKFNGKTYTAKTNAKGVAQKTLNKKVINKLKKGKTYTVKVTYLKDTIKTTVKVR